MDRKNKLWSFLKTKGFYLALAVAIAGAGTAAWLTAQNAVRGIEEQVEAKNPPPVVKREVKEWEYEDILRQQTEGKKTPNTSDPEPSLSTHKEPATPTEAPALPTDKPTPAPKETAPTFCLPVSKAELLSSYSGKAPIKNHTLGVWRTHDGIDLSAPKGSPVSAAAAGTVQTIETDPLWGGVISVRHTGGYCTVYSGVLPEKGLKVGTQVEAGQILGTLAEIPAEIAMESHLHFAMTKDGASLDPAPLLPLHLQDK